MTAREKSNYGERRKVWVNFVLNGEPCNLYLEFKKKDIAHSTRDVFTLGLRCLQERIMEMDLKKAQLAASRRLSKELNEEGISPACGGYRESPRPF